VYFIRIKGHTDWETES